MDNQAEFHPQRFLAGLAAALERGGARICEETRALSLRDGAPCTVETTGGRVTAGHERRSDAVRALRVHACEEQPAVGEREVRRDHHEENANVAFHFFADRVTRRSGDSADDLAPGQGKVVSRHGRQVAVSRDDHGTVRAVSARCTHLGCILAWNDAERTWDCPCHASRFAADGSVLQGPAVHALESRPAP